MRTRSVTCSAISFLIATTSLFGFIIYSANAVETIIIECNADAYISNREEISGAAENLQVGYIYGITWTAYVMFNLSEIPLYVKVESVELQIKVDSFALEWINWVSAFLASSEWNETETNWGNKPEKISFLGAQRIALLNEWYSWEDPLLTEAVEEAVHQKHNLSIGLESSFLQSCLVFFFSRESGNAPRLLVTYKPDLAGPSINILDIQPDTPTPDDEVTLRVVANDSFSGVKEVFLYYSINATTDWNKVLLMSKDSSTYEGTIPKQSENTTVYYYIEALDNAGNRQESPTYSYISRFLNVPLWAMVVATFIVFGLPIIGIIGLVYFFRRRRRKDKENQRALPKPNF